MPPSKKQKTVHDSGVYVESDSDDSAFESAHPHKNDSQSTNANSQDQSQDPAPHDYICVYRPLFDVKNENWMTWETNPSAHVPNEEVASKLWRPGFEAEQESGIYKKPATEHKDHKWIIMWGAWLKTDVIGRKSKYCDPNEFGLWMCNDWRGWGLQEIAENMLLEFDRAFKMKGEKRIEEMWVVVTAVGLWLNEDDHIDVLMGNEDGDTTCQLFGLIGCAFLTALATVEQAGELKPDSRILDLPLVISYYLELSYDLPAYGIEGEHVSWRKEAVKYFKKGFLDPQKGLATTKLRLEKLERVNDYNCENADTEEEEQVSTPAGASAEAPIHIPDDEGDKENANPEVANAGAVSPPAKKNGRNKFGETKDAEKDPWVWQSSFKEYKKSRDNHVGGQHHDITKMSRADRAAESMDEKDPLASIAVKDLKANLLAM